MKAIHLICRREGTGYKGLDPAPEGKNVWMSYAWAFPKDFDLISLVGGWVYLHPISKAAPSEFGGVIKDIIEIDRIDKAREEGHMIVFEAKLDARGKKWRGYNHGMAWTSGIVTADFGHEKAGGNAQGGPKVKSDPPT